jgi:hypothetical protein
MFMPRAIATMVDKVARQSVGKDWGLYAALLDHWQEIVGMDYARVTTPVKITFPHQPTEARRHGGTLSVRLPKGLAMEFSFKAAQIQQRINTYFGYDAIARIQFEPVYGTPKPEAQPPREPDAAILADIKSSVKSIDNDDLRAALQAFGEAVLTSPDLSELRKDGRRG